MNARELKEFVLSLKERGLSGMESDYFAQTYEKRQEMRRIAAGADLFVTGGSDFHSFGSAVALGECNCRLSERALKALGAGNNPPKSIIGSRTLGGRNEKRIGF